jgi:hypothetical protein
LKRLIALTLLLAAPVMAQEGDGKLVGELMAFHGSKAIVSAMTTHCYETTGLDAAYQTANDNRVAVKLGGGTPEEIAAAETYGGTQIMSAYNQAEDKETFCRAFLEQVDSGALDIDKQLPAALEKAQAIAAQ